MRRTFLLLPVALWALLWGWSLAQEGEGGERPRETAPPQGGQGGTVISTGRALELLASAKRELWLYLDAFTEENLAQTLHRAIIQKRVQVRLLLPKESFSLPGSYAMPFAFLSLRHRNLEVKVLGGSRVDPRILGDSSWMLVGHPLEGLPPEAKGPLLLFTDPKLVQQEQNRFNLYWQRAPYCRPRAQYQDLGSIRTWCELRYER